MTQRLLNLIDVQVVLAMQEDIRLGRYRK
jgi:hypothetical protein